MGETASEERKDLQLARLWSDGAVFQRDRQVSVWGLDTPGTRVRAVLKRETELSGFSTRAAETVAGPDGRFQILLPPVPSGGPYRLTVADTLGRSVTAWNLLAGDVWYISGQSNVDVNLERCKDEYPEEIRSSGCSNVRTFRIDTDAEFHGPLWDTRSGKWEEAELNTILAFSAVGYFFSSALYRENHGIPVGLIQASLGGSLISSWMSREMLEGYDELLAESDRYGDDAFRAEILRRNETEPAAWDRELCGKDQGVQEHWELSGIPDSQKIQIPCLFQDTALQGHVGSVWLEKKISLPPEMAWHGASLWLSTIVDSDTVYVNGTKVGETAYQYPPRKYRVPEGILRAGENRISVRVVVWNGAGRVTPGKGCFLFNDQGVVDLQGTWDYRIGARMDREIPPTDQVNWKATGLFNGMAAPCAKYTVSGLIWYQGESNAEEKSDYQDLLMRYAEGYRKLFGEDLPFLIVQLPNFTADLEEDQSWPKVRECQRRAACALPRTGLVSSIDLGEDNDLHPHGKKQIGERLANLARRLTAPEDSALPEWTGPVPVSLERVSTEAGDAFLLRLSHADGLTAFSFDKGSRILDFELESQEGEICPAEAEIREESICLHTDKALEVSALRYVFHNTNAGALIYNGARLPMAPFRMTAAELGLMPEDAPDASAFERGKQKEENH